MAIQTKDRFSEIIGNSPTGIRIESWAWHYLINFCNFPSDGNIKIADRNMMAEFIIRNKIEPTFCNTFKTSLLPDIKLDWISDDPRQIEWIKMRMGIKQSGFLDLKGYNQWTMQNFTNTKSLNLTATTNSESDIKNLKIRNGLSDQDRIILMIDLDQNDLSIKESVINELKNEWMLRAKRDEIFDWFSEYNSEKYKILDSTIKKYLSDRNFPSGVISSFQDLLIKFDHISCTNMEIVNLVEKCRVAFNQKIRRAKVDNKKQLNVLISKKSIDQLEKLASKHSFSKAQIIEILINNESKNEIYLNGRAEEIKKLLG